MTKISFINETGLCFKQGNLRLEELKWSSDIIWPNVTLIDIRTLSYGAKNNKMRPARETCWWFVPVSFFSSSSRLMQNSHGGEGGDTHMLILLARKD
ncbi:hypothetical protein YC2023_034506 [Brassica napus]